MRERGGREGGREGSRFLDDTGIDAATSHPLLKELIGLLQLLGFLLQPGKHSPGLLQQLAWSICEGLTGPKVSTVGGGGVSGGKGRMVAMGGLGRSQRDFLWLGEWPEERSGSLSMAAASASDLACLPPPWSGRGLVPELVVQVLHLPQRSPQLHRLLRHLPLEPGAELRLRGQLSPQLLTLELCPQHLPLVGPPGLLHLRLQGRG